jgi:hypothetical protein
MGTSPTVNQALDVETALTTTGEHWCGLDEYLPAVMQWEGTPSPRDARRQRITESQSVGKTAKGVQADVSHHPRPTERGRRAGEELGDHPAGAVAELAGRVVALGDACSDDDPVATPAGKMTFAGYLPTRTFELAVHSLDLARALGVPPPGVLGPATAAAGKLAGALAAQHPNAAKLLPLLTGRRSGVEDVSVL